MTDFTTIDAQYEALGAAIVQLKGADADLAAASTAVEAREAQLAQAVAVREDAVANLQGKDAVTEDAVKALLEALAAIGVLPEEGPE